MIKPVRFRRGKGNKGAPTEATIETSQSSFSSTQLKLQAPVDAAFQRSAQTSVDRPVPNIVVQPANDPDIDEEFEACLTREVLEYLAEREALEAQSTETHVEQPSIVVTAPLPELQTTNSTIQVVPHPEERPTQQQEVEPASIAVEKQQVESPKNVPQQLFEQAIPLVDEVPAPQVFANEQAQTVANETFPGEQGEDVRRAIEFLSEQTASSDEPVFETLESVLEAYPIDPYWPEPGGRIEYWQEPIFGYIASESEELWRAPNLKPAVPFSESDQQVHPTVINNQPLENLWSDPIFAAAEADPSQNSLQSQWVTSSVLREFFDDPVFELETPEMRQAQAEELAQKQISAAANHLESEMVPSAEDATMEDAVVAGESTDNSRQNVILQPSVVDGQHHQLHEHPQQAFHEKIEYSEPVGAREFHQHVHENPQPATLAASEHLQLPLVHELQRILHEDSQPDQTVLAEHSQPVPSANQHVDPLQHQSRALQEQVEQLLQTNHGLSLRIQSLEQDKETLRVDAEAHSDALRKEKAETKSAHDILQKQETVVRHLSQKVEYLEEQNEKIYTVAEADAEKLQQEKADVEFACDVLKKQNSELAGDKRRVETTLLTEQKSQAKLIESMEKDMTALRNEIIRKDQKIAEQASQAKLLDKRINDLKEQENRADQASRINGKLEQENGELRKENVEQRKKIADHAVVKTELVSAQQTITALNDELAQWKDDEEQIRTRIIPRSRGDSPVVHRKTEERGRSLQIDLASADDSASELSEEEEAPIHRQRTPAEEMAARADYIREETSKDQSFRALLAETRGEQYDFGTSQTLLPEQSLSLTSVMTVVDAAHTASSQKLTKAPVQTVWSRDYSPASTVSTITSPTTIMAEGTSPKILKKQTEEVSVSTDTADPSAIASGTSPLNPATTIIPGEETTQMSKQVDSMWSDSSLQGINEMADLSDSSHLMPHNSFDCFLGVYKNLFLIMILWMNICVSQSDRILNFRRWSSGKDKLARPPTSVVFDELPAQNPVTETLTARHAFVEDVEDDDMDSSWNISQEEATDVSRDDASSVTKVDRNDEDIESPQQPEYVIRITSPCWFALKVEEAQARRPSLHQTLISLALHAAILLALLFGLWGTSELASANPYIAPSDRVFACNRAALAWVLGQTRYEAFLDIMNRQFLPEGFPIANLPGTLHVPDRCW